MRLILYTKSPALVESLKQRLQLPVTIQDQLPELLSDDPLHLLHITSLGPEVIQRLSSYAGADLKIAVCSDRPDINEMLQCVQAGSKAYCNSYMQADLLRQMMEALENGQSWFPPQMLEHTFQLAMSALGVQKKPQAESLLTARENEIAQSVADGLSNNQIAQRYDISLRTVKAHLTNIFKKLGIKDRVALVLRFK